MPEPLFSMAFNLRQLASYAATIDQSFITLGLVSFG
jgi:hypothetical protein